VSALCTKGRRYWRRCATWRAYQEAAYAEWPVAETLEAVRAAWGRFGGSVTYHRYGSELYREMSRIRWMRVKAQEEMTAA
jgi:hypothetical protein